MDETTTTTPDISTSAPGEAQLVEAQLVGTQLVHSEQLVETELLVEEISIDGMCGVY